MELVAFLLGFLVIAAVMYRAIRFIRRSLDEATEFRRLNHGPWRKG